MDHQRINGTPSVFSAAVPALLAVSASEGINILRNTPSILSTLQENVRAIRAVLYRIGAVTIPSHAASPIIHMQLRSATLPSRRCSLSGNDRTCNSRADLKLTYTLIVALLSSFKVYTCTLHSVRRYFTYYSNACV